MRRPFGHEEALRLLSHADRGRIGGLVAPISFAMCWHVATAHHDVDPRPLFRAAETTCELAPMNRAALRRALEAEAEAILTRNEQDFAGGPLTPHRPETFLSMLQG